MANNKKRIPALAQSNSMAVGLIRKSSVDFIRRPNPPKPKAITFNQNQQKSNQDRIDIDSAADQGDQNRQQKLLMLTNSDQTPNSTKKNRSVCYKKTVRLLDACGKGLNKAYQKFGLRHVTPFFVLLIYSLVGALLFQYIESSHELMQEKERDKKIDALRNATAWNLTYILSNPVMRDETKRMQTRDFIYYHEQQLALLNRQSLTTPVSLRWDLWGALFYVITIYTTIGYGNLAPATNAGRLLTVIYALFGIPLVLAILNDLGQLLRKWINGGWWIALTHWRRRPRNLFRKKTVAVGQINGSIPSAVVDPQQQADVDADEQAETVIPVSVALALTLGWVLICSGIFCIWETNWSYGTSLYFFFISLSTIGLGDVVPDKPHFMLANFILVIVGLCLVSMTLGVIQQRIEQWLYNVMKQMAEEWANVMGDQDQIDGSDAENGHDRRRSSTTNSARLLASAWSKQSWYTRWIMPALIGRQQQRRLNVCAQRLARGKDLSTIVRDLMVLGHDNSNNADQDDHDHESDQNQRSRNRRKTKYASDSRRSSSSSSSTSSKCCLKIKDETKTRFPSPPPPPPLTAPALVTKFLCDNSTQTDKPSTTAFFDVVDVERHFAERCKKRNQEISEKIMSPTKRDQETQVRIYAQQQSVAAQADISLIVANNIKQTPIKKKSKLFRRSADTQTSSSTCGNGNDKDSDNGHVLKVEKIVQTDDSYLKLASKLEALRTNRADSLAIMKTPTLKKSQKTQEQQQTKK